MIQRFQNLSSLSIRYKLLIGYSLLFLVALVCGNFVIFTVFRNTIEENIERELKTSTDLILNMVRTAANASIKNHLRAVSERNREVVQFYYNRFKRREIGENEAREEAQKVLLSQTIGKTGYIYCIDSAGIIRVHPKQDLMNVDLSKYGFIEEQKRQKEGYIEYDWANPGETSTRPKALYMTYFEPWDWIISVSSYRDEFKGLFNVKDFRDNILSLRFGKTGYPYVIDSKGTLIIHPKLEGTNIFESEDSIGRSFIQQMCERKNGKIVYPWKNPGEPQPREKLVIFNYISELDWIVASSSYLEEFYAPLKTVGWTALITMGVMLLLVFPITWWISASISTPVHQLMTQFSAGVGGDLSGRMPVDRSDELGRLAQYYNQFMETLQRSNQSLHQSEEKYRRIFEDAIEGFFQMDIHGKLLNANPSLAEMLGYDSPQHLIDDLDMALQINDTLEQRQNFFNELKREGFLTGNETRIRKKGGERIWVSVNARAIKDEAGWIHAIDGSITDITERKQSEDNQRRIQEELENKVSERTRELSSYIDELEQRNVQSATLREMGEMLQVCRSTAEAYPIIDHYMRKLFPDCPGALFVFSKTENNFQQIISWRNPVALKEDFSRTECWALRQDKVYLIESAGDRLPCNHFEADMTSGYACIPMISQGELIGLLHLQFGEVASTQEERGKKIIPLAITVTEHLALALTNLNLRETLSIRSYQDPLTGLHNRRFMDDYLEREMKRVKRHGMCLSMLMIDIDHFKRVNDQFGHEAGDMVLQEVSTFFQQGTRKEDIVCRYGGEEFVILLTQCSLEDAINKANSIKTGLKEKIKVSHNGATIRVTISIGVAAFPEHGGSPNELFNAADVALYKAKEQGRDRVVAAR